MSSVLGKGRLLISGKKTSLIKMFNAKLAIFCIAVALVSRSYAIIDGTPLQPRQRTYSCILKTKDIGSTEFSGECACAIIDAIRIVTAAHCVVSDNIDSMLISYGSEKFSDTNRQSQIVPRSNVIYIPLLYLGPPANQK